MVDRERDNRYNYILNRGAGVHKEDESNFSAGGEGIPKKKRITKNKLASG